jgi:fructokinase
VVVAGENLVDLIGRGAELAAVTGGGPYNVARTLGRLGRPTAYVGVISTDRFGRAIRAQLRADGVDDSWATDSALPTTLALAELDESGGATYRFYTEGTAAPSLDVDTARTALAARPSVVYIGTLGLLLQPMADALTDLVDSLAGDVVVAVDPNCRPSAVVDERGYRARLDRVLSRADVVKVSTEDLAWLSPGCEAGRAAADLAVRSGGAVLVTAGGEAGVLVLSGGRTATVGVEPVEVVDTVGAGDSFVGGFLAHWHEAGLGRDETRDLEQVVEATRFGARVAAVTCTRVGADPPRRDELA